jgi:VanZ family protein
VTGRLSAPGLLLLYVLAVSVIITLTPFRFSRPPRLTLAWIAAPGDVVPNVLLFLPLGFLYRLARPRLGWGAVGGAAAVVSAALEAAQIYLPGRYPSVVDVLANSTGAVLGALVHGKMAQRLDARLLRGLALELPLINLVYLLVPLLWLDGLARGHDEARSGPLLLLGLFGGLILTAVWRHRLRSGGSLSANGLTLAAAAWFAVAAFPSAARAPGVVIGCAGGVALLVRLAAARPGPPPEAERRFELPTLRRTTPIYAAYLVLAALWPWPWQPGPWRASLGLADIADLPGALPLLGLVEQLAAFTLLGYMVAEAGGRQRESPAEAGWRVVWVSVVSGAVLELIRGFHPGYVASFGRLAILAAAGLYGGLVYQMQLRLVRQMLGLGGGCPGGQGRPDYDAAHDRASPTVQEG